MMLLAVLASGPAHGYAQAEALRALSGGELDIAEGTLYPALHRLEAEGLVRSSWTPHAGRRRRVYRLTAAGRRALDERRTQWLTVRDAIDAVLTTHPRPGGAPWPAAT